MVVAGALVVLVVASIGVDSTESTVGGAAATGLSPVMQNIDYGRHNCGFTPITDTVHSRNTKFQSPTQSQRRFGVEGSRGIALAVGRSL